MSYRWRKRLSSYQKTIKTAYRVVLVYESQDGRRMEMWSRLLTQDRAGKLASKWKLMGMPNVSVEYFGYDGYNGARQLPRVGWCQELPVP